MLEQATECEQGDRQARVGPGVLAMIEPDAVPGLLWCRNHRDEWVWANRSTLELLGVSAREVLGRGWDAFVHPLDREPLRYVYQRAMVNARGVGFVVRLRHRSGSFRWVLGIARGVGRDAFQPPQLMCCAVEIASADDGDCAQTELLNGVVAVCGGCQRLRGATGRWVEMAQYLALVYGAGEWRGLSLHLPVEWCPLCTAARAVRPDGLREGVE